MVRFIMEMLVNRSFIVHTSDGQTSRLRRLKNRVPQGSVLSPMLFSIYIHDLLDTTATKYGYTDDLAIILRRPTWKLSVGKTVAATYHLNNQEARRELDMYVDKHCLEFQQAPKYLEVRLDGTLSNRILCPCVEQKSTCKQGRYYHQQRPPDSNWSYLPVLDEIAPASLRRDAATLTLARKAQKYDWHILHKATITSVPPGRLKSRHPHNKAAQEMLQSIPEDLSRDAWLAATWKQTWEMAGPSRIQ
ncbi:hypothetical protein AOLI_G00238960 [Acnodon oligacanthus]